MNACLFFSERVGGGGGKGTTGRGLRMAAILIELKESDTEFLCRIFHACAMFYFSESDPASGTGEISPEDY